MLAVSAETVAVDSTLLQVVAVADQQMAVAAAPVF
jgi:hypothetical protein